ncbi:MAG: hypothetical protein ABI406_05060 [Ktedonobacteraceae bacterium]
MRCQVSFNKGSTPLRVLDDWRIAAARACGRDKSRPYVSAGARDEPLPQARRGSIYRAHLDERSNVECLNRPM